MNQRLNALYAYVSAWLTSEKEEGATATEYALIVAGIAVVIVAALFAFGGQLSAYWSSLGSKLSIN